MFWHTEMSICRKEYSGHNYRQGAWEGETPEKAWASWRDAMNTPPGWVGVDGLCGASACGRRNSDLKTAGWRKKNDVLRSSVWKSVRSWQALETPGPGKSTRRDKLRPPRARARLSAHADAYKGCSTRIMLRKAVVAACSLMKHEAKRDLPSTHLKPPEPQHDPLLLSKPPGLASQCLQQGVIANVCPDTWMYHYLLLVITAWCYQ